MSNHQIVLAILLGLAYTSLGSCVQNNLGLMFAGRESPKKCHSGRTSLDSYLGFSCLSFTSNPTSFYVLTIVMQFGTAVPNRTKIICRHCLTMAVALPYPVPAFPLLLPCRKISTCLLQPLIGNFTLLCYMALPSTLYLRLSLLGIIYKSSISFHYLKLITCA